MSELKLTHKSRSRRNYSQLGMYSEAANNSRSEGVRDRIYVSYLTSFVTENFVTGIGGKEIDAKTKLFKFVVSRITNFVR